MGITFLFVTADDVQENSTRFCLEDRYSSAKMTSGIRSHHRMNWQCAGFIQMKLVCIIIL